MLTVSTLQTNTSRAIKFLELVPIPIAQYRNKIVSIQFNSNKNNVELKLIFKKKMYMLLVNIFDFACSCSKIGYTLSIDVTDDKDICIYLFVL